MANLIGFNCPKCGGEINIKEGIRNTICPYCKTRLIMTTSVGIERYYVEPTITSPKTAAKEWFNGYKILDVDMIFIPIVKIHTELMGWLYAYKKGRIEWIQGDDYQQPMEVVKGRDMVKKRINVMREIKIFPFQHLPVDGNRIELDNLQLSPYEDEKLHLYGNVMDPPSTKEFYLNEGIQKLTGELISRYKNYDELSYRIEPVCPRLTIYYYPVVIVRFEGGSASIDAVKKKTIFRISEEDKKVKKNLSTPLITFLFSIFVGSIAMVDVKIAGALFFILLIFLFIINYGD